MSRFKVGFPQVGNYQVPARFLFSNILDCDIIPAPSITQKTIDLGVKYSPQFVCTPFKYTLGTMLELASCGANVLIQLGGGCRYGYYYELQKQIISQMFPDIIYINLITAGHADIFSIYKELKRISKIPLFKSLYYLFVTISMVKYMDLVDSYIRENVGFECNDGDMEKYNNMMLNDFLSVKGYFSLRRIYKKYFKMIRTVKLNKPDNVIKVGVIGELYTVMEPFSNYYLEHALASFNMAVTRYTNATYLLFKKGRFIKKNIKKYRTYVKYRMGADATDNIIRAVNLCRMGYDGIVHIKSSFCTPEIGAMGIINKVCSDYDVPVLFFSFDANTSRVGFETRLEAFNDMIEMRKK